MKIKNILAITALVGLGVSAQATIITFQENGSSTPLGSSSTFTEGSASLTAYASPGAILYAKSDGAGETGLGIQSDPSGDHEIWGQTFVQLLSSTLTPGGFDVTSLGLSSVQFPDVAGIYFSLVQGVLGVQIGTLPADGSFSILSIYQNGYIGVAAVPGNVVLASATGNSVTVPDGGTTVAMLGLGLAAVSLLRRKLAA
jgi:hypothetical protein